MTSLNLQIRLLGPKEIVALVDHGLRHHNESGKDGDFIFVPSEEPNLEPPDVAVAKKSEAWAKPITEVGWQRCWGVVEEATAGSDVKVHGMIVLTHQVRLKSCLHRATLAMGLERPYRAAGLGSQLMQTVIDWARQQPTLEYLDLYVFEHNTPARALYKKFGFQDTGRTVDLFRVYGQKINDFTMTLSLR